MWQDCGPLSKPATPVHKSRSRTGLLSDRAGDGSSGKGVLVILTGLVTGQEWERGVGDPDRAGDWAVI